MELNEKDFDEITSEDDSVLNVSALVQNDTVSTEETETDSVVLDLSSLSADEEEIHNTAEPSSVTESSGDSLYNKTVAMIENGEIDVEHGIVLLKKAANEGCALSWLYLGELYSDSRRSIYNPALAFESFWGAAKLGDGRGHYYLGLCYSEGFGCEKNENYAVESFMSGAESGDSDCICALGICREFGIGCDINYEMAVALYSAAAENENASAINNLAGCYFYGHGIPQDKVHAIELYEQAAFLGNAAAECRLGICYEEGDGCFPDPTVAFEHYNSAAEKNNSTALYRLALCYDKGIGTEQNFAEAFKYYELSAKHGCPDAMHEAGLMYKTGRGTKKNETAAYKMFASAADAGFSNSEYEVGNCFFGGIGTVRNREFAFSRYTRAFDADNGNFAAAFKLGLCNLKGLGTKKDVATAVEWFKKADSLGSPAATYMMGECYFYGIGVEKDQEAAVSCFEKAVSYDYEYADNLRTVPALLALAECFENGTGTVKDHKKALLLYKQASETGDAEACFRTGKAILCGNGIKSEYAAARTYIIRAARKGHIPAMLTMGRFAEEGKGIQKNQEDAKRWYTQAIKAEITASPGLYDYPERFFENRNSLTEAKAEAQFRLGLLLAKHEPSAKSYMTAFEYIALSAAMGHADAQTEIAKIHECGGDIKTYYESKDNQKRPQTNPEKDVADHSPNISAAMNKLGNSFLDGTATVKKNETAAAKCYKIAAEMGNNDARYSYGWCLRHGIGLRENNVEAVKWLKLSADKGNVNACYSYGLCCEEGLGTGVENRREALHYYRMAAASGHVEATQRYRKLSGG